jgi:hypothetical protein
MLLSFAQWVQETGVAVFLRGSGIIYPLILSFHLAAIAMTVAMIIMCDLRLLGLALRRYSISDVYGQLRWPKVCGFLVILVCGLLLACSKAEEYYYNVFFWAKMSLLALIAVNSLVFRGSVYGNTAALDKAARLPGSAKLAAILSLVLWIGVVICGRGIGYIEPPLEKLHAQVHVTGVAEHRP